MAVGGTAWRGWFPLGGELTSGVPDRKEGYYFGARAAARPAADARPQHLARRDPPGCERAVDRRG